MRYLLCALALGGALAASSVQAAVTGNPLADGWNLQGNSLQSGTYVTGTGNYAYDAFGIGLTVQAGSNLEISDGANSWLAGDTVVGVGGVFRTITNAEAGWTIGGGAQNGLLPSSAPYSGPKLQVKFGTSAATWVTSTSAPTAANGNSSSSNGGGRIQIRTSGYFQTGTPTPGQTEPWTWDGNSGQLLLLDKSSHIDWAGGAAANPTKQVARMIWNWDNTLKQVTSWELLLNVDLLSRLYPSYAGLLPGIGDMAIMTVQPGDSGSFTDALVRTTAAVGAVPEPGGLAVWSLLGLTIGGARYWRRKRSA